MDNLMDTMRSFAQQVAEWVVVQKGIEKAVVRFMRAAPQKQTIKSEMPGTRTGDLVTVNYVFENGTKVLVGVIEGTGVLKACVITARPEAYVHGAWEPTDMEQPLLQHHVPPEELSEFHTQLMKKVGGAS